MSSGNVGFTVQVARETGLKRAGLGIMIRRGSQHARRAAGAASSAGVKHKRRSTVRKLFDKSRFSNLRDFAKIDELGVHNHRSLFSPWLLSTPSPQQLAHSESLAPPRASRVAPLRVPSATLPLPESTSA